MQLVDTLDNPRAAQAFVDYMALKSIEIVIKPSAEHKIELWVDTPFYETACSDLAEFLKNPHQQKYLDASWQRNNTENPLSYKSGSSLVKSWFSQGGWVTHGVVALCVITFVLAHFTNMYDLLRFPSNASVSDGQLWRWFTPALFHFDIFHIAFNLLWWWMLASLLEKHFSPTFLILFTLFTAVISNFAQFITSGNPNFGGLSGVVYALMGFCWLYGRLKPRQDVMLKDPLFVFALIWLMAGFADMLWVNVANAAHLGGLLAGLAFAFIYAGIIDKKPNL